MTDTKQNKMERIIAALLEHGSQERAAKALELSPVTIWRWSQKPEFQQAYDEARRDAFHRAMARAQYTANRAISTLLTIMYDKETGPATRVRAAESLLGQAGASYAADLARRVEQLERRKKLPK